MRLGHIRRPRAAAADVYGDATRSSRVCDLVVVGAHGGAGVSTLAALLTPAWGLGSLSGLLEPARSPIRTKDRPLVVACRNTTAAAQRAISAVTVLEAWDEQVSVLAVVSDGGPEPRDATARFALLADRVDAIVRVPYVRDLRLVDDPAEADLPRRARCALAEIRGVAERHADRRVGSRGESR